MSDNLKPWLRRYVLEHAQSYGLELEQCKPLTRLCQLIHFRTYEISDDPYGPPGGLWADISDGQWHVPVHIPTPSVEAVVRAHGPMTKLTGGLFSVNPTGFMFQCLPTTRTAVERDPRLAMRIDVKSYVGSAGENIFKDPKPMMNDSAVSTWVRALGGDNGARHTFSDAATAALLEEQKRRSMQPARKPSRTGSTVIAGMIPRERNAPQHAKSNSGTGLNIKEREHETSRKATQRTAKDKALAEYRALWGKRSLKMKWYLIPDDQRVILDKIDFPTDEEVIMRALAPPEPAPHRPPRPSRDALDLGNATSPAPARLTALPSSPPLPAPSSLPTQTATSAAPSRAMSPDLGPPEPMMSPELGPPEDPDDKDDGGDDDDAQAIEWSSSPAPQQADDEHEKFAFATPRPPSQPVILVPNSDPSSRATNSQSQSQSVAPGSQSQSVAAASQQSQSSRRNLLAPSGSQDKQQHHQPSSAAPTHVSDTVLHSSAPGPPAADGDESLTQSTSQSQSQKAPEVQQQPEPIVEAATEPQESRPQGSGRPAESAAAAMEVDLPAPVAGEKPDDNDTSAYAFLVAVGDGGGSRVRKRARVHDGSTSPAAKRARRSGESTEGEARSTAAREPSLPPSSQGTGARARKTVSTNGQAKRTKGLPDGAKPASSADRTRPGPVGPVQAEPSPANNARPPVALDIARYPGIPVKVESPSPVHAQKRSPEAQRPVAVQREQDTAQPPDITLQGVVDMLFRLGQARQRDAAVKAKAANPRP